MSAIVQVAKEAKRVVARLDAAERHSHHAHSAHPDRKGLASLYSLGHKASLNHKNHDDNTILRQVTGFAKYLRHKLISKSGEVACYC